MKRTLLMLVFLAIVVAGAYAERGEFAIGGEWLLLITVVGTGIMEIRGLIRKRARRKNRKQKEKEAWRKEKERIRAELAYIERRDAEKRAKEKCPDQRQLEQGQNNLINQMLSQKCCDVNNRKDGIYGKLGNGEPGARKALVPENQTLVCFHG